MTETKETKETTQAAETVREFADLILLAAKKRQLKKAVLSKPCDAADKRAELTLRRIGGRDRLQAEKFRADNKALHENLPTEMSDGLLDLLAGYGQVNLLTAVGECELRRGKRGTTTVLGGEKLRKRLDAVQTDGAKPSPKTTGTSSTSCAGTSRFYACLTSATSGGECATSGRRSSAKSTAFWNWSAIASATCPRRDPCASAISAAAKVIFPLQPTITLRISSGARSA